MRCFGFSPIAFVCPPPLPWQFGAIRRFAMLDLEAEPDTPGVRFPQAAHTQGWSCSLNAGPNGANAHCIHDTAGCVPRHAHRREMRRLDLRS